MKKVTMFYLFSVLIVFFTTIIMIGFLLHNPDPSMTFRLIIGVVLFMDIFMLLIASLIYSSTTNNKAFFLKYDELLEKENEVKKTFEMLNKAWRVIGQHEALEYYDKHRPSRSNRKKWIYKRVNK